MASFKRILVTSEAVDTDLDEFSEIFQDVGGYVTDVDFSSNRLIGTAPNIRSVRAQIRALDRNSKIRIAAPISRRK